MAKKAKVTKPKAEVIEFVLDEPEVISSPARPAPAEVGLPPVVLQPKEEAAAVEERSAAFKELALPRLPMLERLNRARLQVQSPNRIFFYWSISTNPYQALQRALGSEAAGYTLVLRLIEIATEREEIHTIEAEGSFWFNTEAGASYRAEIGFYSPSKPFVRIMFSNTVTTPRKSPSPRAATESEWRLSSDKFAEVLHVSGFQRDAFDVALAGDDPFAADEAAHRALADLIGRADYERNAITGEDIRLALLAIAGGQALEALRWRIGAALFALLEAHAARVAAANAAEALSANFDIIESDFEEEEVGPAVFGASSVNFPRRIKKRTLGDHSPFSSHILGK